MITIENIIKTLKEQGVSDDKIEEVNKSFLLASEIHKDQYRQSGEPYITHPLNVAKNLLDMEVYDTNAICAALLHDTIEDAKDDFSKEDIKRIINADVAELVDGVTKMRRINFVTKESQRLANTRKITNGLSKDVRIILIKLADRKHNMETLEFKRPEKQQENAIETMELFVPLALSIGAYKIKSELEDLSLMYIEPDDFKKISEEKKKIEEQKKEYLVEMKYKISEILKQKNIPNDILLRTKNICTTYKKILQGYKLENIYDLFYLKILVEEVDDCYRTLGLVHGEYPHINGRLKDYISNPRTNLYKSLHTTVAVDDKPTKVKIRTHDMDKVTAYGVPALWNIKNGMTQKETQTFIRESIPFVRDLMQIDKTSKSDLDFISKAKKKLLTEHVYVYDGGEIVELPAGATAMDFVYETHPELTDYIENIIVNGKIVPSTQVLENMDGVEVKTKKSIKQLRK